MMELEYLDVQTMSSERIDGTEN